MGAKPTPRLNPTSPWHPRSLAKRAFALEALVVAFVVVASVLLGFIISDRLIAGLALHDAATQFAVALRQAQTIARDRNSCIRIGIKPATPEAPCRYVIQDGALEIAQGKFPSGVSASGVTELDPHGVPLASARFDFRKYTNKLTVMIDEKGIVSIP